MRGTPRYKIIGLAMQDIVQVIRIIGDEEEIIKTFPGDATEEELHKFVGDDGEKWLRDNSELYHAKHYTHEGSGRAHRGGAHDSYTIFEETGDGRKRMVAVVSERMDTWNIVGLLNQAWDERKRIKYEREKKVSLDTQKFYLEEIKSMMEVISWFHRDSPEGNVLLTDYANYSRNGMSLTTARKFHQKLNQFFSEDKGGY